MDVLNNEAKKMFEAIRLNEQEEAFVHFEQSLKQSKEEQDVNGLAEFGQALHLAGFLDQAKDVYDLLKEIAPGLTEWDLFLAEIAIDQNRIEDGLDILLQIDQTSDLYPNALLMMADAYQTMGLYEVSEYKIKEAMKILPDEVVLTYALAQLYHSNGKYKEAISLYEDLVEKDTVDMWQENLFILLADCHNVIGNFEEGIEYLEQLYDDQHTSDSLFQLGFAYLQVKQYNRSIKILEQLLEKDPDYNTAYYYLAVSLEEDHQHQEALEMVKRAIAVNAFQADYYLLEAKLNLKLDKKVEAEASLDRALGLEPDLMEAQLLKLDLLIGQDAFEEVVNVIEAEDDANKQNPQFQWRLAKAYNELEDYDKAGLAFEQAYLTLADNLSFLEDYSDFLREEGNQEELAELVAKALMLDANHPYFNELRDHLLAGE